MAKKRKQERLEDKRIKQVDLPTLERPSNPDIERTVGELVRIKEKVASLKEDEVTTKEELLEVMTKARLKKYRTDDDKIVTIEPKQQIKIKQAEDVSIPVEE